MWNNTGKFKWPPDLFFLSKPSLRQLSEHFLKTQITVCGPSFTLKLQLIAISNSLLDFPMWTSSLQSSAIYLNLNLAIFTLVKSRFIEVFLYIVFWARQSESKIN